MHRIFSNGPERDYVINPLEQLIAASSQLQMAAPYFNAAEPVLQAAAAGKRVHLLIGLNEATRPDALKKVLRERSVVVRYLTGGFHAKIYLGDAAALLGSANLTTAGLKGNREAVIRLDQREDAEAIEELRLVFGDLWHSAKAVTDAVFLRFEASWLATRQTGPTRDEIIADAVGAAPPHSVQVGSGVKSRERLFIDLLQRQVHEQYRPAFEEVTEILEAGGFRRPELADFGRSSETNRFLNWVRLVHAPGDQPWARDIEPDAANRQREIATLGAQWVQAKDNRVPESFGEWLREVTRVFGTPDALAAAGREDLTHGLMSLHAFTEQLRHVKGGAAGLEADFWQQNGNDVARVRGSLLELVHGPGDFVERLYDYDYVPGRKLKRIGRFTALELFGTVKPEECPPVNGRMAKALRYLGYDVVTD